MTRHIIALVTLVLSHASCDHLLGKDIDNPLSVADMVAGIQKLRKEPNDPFTPKPIKEFAKKRLLYRLDRSKLGDAAKQLVGHYEKHDSLDFDMLLEWTKNDPKAVFEHLIKFDPRWFDCVLGTELFERWAAFEPRQALAAAQLLKNPDRIYDVLGMIAVDSPTRALELLPANASSQYGFARDVLSYWAATNPDDATEWVLSQPKRSFLVWTLGFVRSQLNHDQTRKWANSLSGNDRTQAVAGMIYERISPSDGEPAKPEVPSAEFIEFFPDTPLTQEGIADQDVKTLAEAIAGAWVANGNFQEGVKWVHHFKPSDGRNEIHCQIVGHWSEKKPAEVLSYLKELGSGPEFDRALGYCATNLARFDPSEVFRLSQGTKEELWRRTARIRCFSLWLQIAPRDALSALETLPKAEATEIESAVSKSAKSPPKRSF
jgi:hypothetical protein